VHPRIPSIDARYCAHARKASLTEKNSVLSNFWRNEATQKSVIMHLRVVHHFAGDRQVAAAQ
jgi:hypothetical protein